MTSLSLASVVDSRGVTRTICCDVTAAVERAANESIVEVTSDPQETVTSSDTAFTWSTGSNGGQSRDYATQSITAHTEHDVTAERNRMLTTTSAASHQSNEPVVQRLLVTEDYQTTRDAGRVSSQHNSSSLAVTLAVVSDTSTSSAITTHLTEQFGNASFTDTQTLFTNALREHKTARLPLPLALRSSADNASMSAAVGSNMADRRATSGLLREEVATVGAAVAGVVVFWSLLAFAMCVIVRMRKRKQRRRMRGSDVDAQTAMMEAMVRAELARGRSRVSDSQVPPTYVNVAELIPRPSSCDLDMSDFFHFVLDDNHPDSRGVWKKQRYNDVIFGRPRDHAALWQDGSRTMHPREAVYSSTVHRPNNCRQLNSRDHYNLLNDAIKSTNSSNGQLPCNGLLTKVKSLDSICEAGDELAVERKHRQRPRRRRRNGVSRSASTSRCLVSTNNKLTSSANAPANGDITKTDNDATADDDVKCQHSVNDVTQPAEYANQSPRPEAKDQTTAVQPTDVTRTPEVAGQGDKMALPETCSLGDREPAGKSPSSQEGMFGARTCTTQMTQRAGPLQIHRHLPPYRIMTSAVRPPCSDRLQRLLRYPPPPPPPPPLSGHVMRLFVTSSDMTCSRLNASVASTAGRPVRFPRMGHTGLATNSCQRTSLQQPVSADHFQL